MESWENNILADKLNNLQDLPDGYMPNLSSKWEIVEAGLPGKKKRRIPLYIRWSVAAAVLLAIGLVWINIDNRKADNYVAKPVNAPTNNQAIPDLTAVSPTPKKNAVPLHKEINHSVKNNEVKTAHLQSKTFSTQVFKDTNQHTNQVLPDVAKTEITTPKNLPATLPDKIDLQENNEVASIIQTEKTKPARKKVYQRDFNDGVLAMDTGFTNTSSQHFSIKLAPFSRKTTSNDEPPARQMQVKTSF